MRNVTHPVGCDGDRRRQMKNDVKVSAIPRTSVLSYVAVAFIGLAVMTLAGHVQAATLHDAAHDVRHATGFPCH